tara:strand:+ start:1690 stop:2946 length:1257 start_codon:yes stop_codon:yes gene_type:complete
MNSIFVKIRNNQIEFLNFLFKGLSLIISLLIIYLLRNNYPEIDQANYFKGLVVIAIGVSISYSPSSFFMTDNKVEFSKIKSLFKIHVIFSLLFTLLFVLMAYKAFKLKSEIIYPYFIAINSISISGFMLDVLMYRNKSIFYGFFAFFLAPLVTFTFCFLQYDVYDLLYLGPLISFFFLFLVFAIYTKKLEQSKLKLKSILNYKTIYFDNIFNSIKGNLDKIIFSFLASDNQVATYFSIEKIFRLWITFFNTNAQYYYVEWSKIYDFKKVLNRFYIIRKNFNIYFHFSFFMFVVTSGYTLSFLNLNDQESKYYVFFLMLVTGIKILSGYTINLIKVSNYRNVLLSNFSHFSLSIIGYAFLYFIFEQPFSLLFGILFSAIILSFIHFIFIKKSIKISYIHFNKIDILFLTINCLIFWLWF